MIESYIAIEGPIGVGKTSLAEIIADKLNTRKVLEKFKDNPNVIFRWAVGGLNKKNSSSWILSEWDKK